MQNVKEVARQPEIDLDQYSLDFGELQVYERNAEYHLREVEGLEFWEASEYERHYLPHLRLAGIRDKQSVILQNSADVHVHSHWSDGDNLYDVIEQAVSLGLDAIAITDHDEIRGALEARRIVHCERIPLAIIPGIEVSSQEGHIGALFITRPIPAGLSARETIDLIHRAGGIAVAHHPFSPAWLEALLKTKLSCRDLIRQLPFDAIECSNAVPGNGSRYNIAAIEAMRRDFINVAVTGGSDAHRAMFVGKGRTYYAGNQGILSLREALRSGFTMGAEGYWKTHEKAYYYWTVLKAVYRKLFQEKKPINTSLLN